jgi:alcohol dehydrogenase class IV
MAGAAFSITGTAAGHALSFILSEDWHIPHGTACAFTLLDIFDLAIGEAQTARSLGRIMRRLDPVQDNRAKPGDNSVSSGESISVQALRSHIAGMMNDMSIPRTFKELGIALTPGEIASYFDRAFSDPKMLNQIPRAAKENIYPLLEKKC